MNNGDLLKAELKALGLRFNFVAEKVGIHRGQLNKYLNGHQNIPEIKLRAICLTFNIPLKKFGLDDYQRSQSGAA